MSQDHVNPLGLLVRPGGHDLPLSHESVGTLKHASVDRTDLRSTSDTMKNGSAEYSRNRVRRELDYVVGAESYVRNNEKPLRIVKMVPTSTMPSLL